MTPDDMQFHMLKIGEAAQGDGNPHELMYVTRKALTAAYHAGFAAGQRDEAAYRYVISDLTSKAEAADDA